MPHVRKLFSVALVAAPLGIASAQVSSIEVVMPRDMGRTGAFRSPVTSEELQVQAKLYNGDTQVTSCKSAFASGNASVLRIVRQDGQSAWVVPAAEGITEITVTPACSARLARTVPVVVGNAAITSPVRAPARYSPVREKGHSAYVFYPVSMVMSPPGYFPIVQGNLVVLKKWGEFQIVARVADSLDNTVGPSEFPMLWSSSNEGVLRVKNIDGHSVFLEPVGTGSTIITANVEGMRQHFPVVVIDAENAPETNSKLATTTLMRGYRLLGTGALGSLSPTVAETSGTPVLTGPTTTRSDPLSINGMQVADADIRVVSKSTPITPGDVYVSVDDIAEAIRPPGGTVVKVEGSTLSIGPAADSLDNFFSNPVSLPITVKPGSGGTLLPITVKPGGTISADSLDNFLVNPLALPITVKTGGVLSTSVRMIDGQPYVPLSDLSKAMGGTAEITPTGVRFGIPTCAECALVPLSPLKPTGGTP
ncbi:MAG TPA: hypothetical protein VF042_09785 [Gemmatimonadaceae bacterium]